MPEGSDLAMQAIASRPRFIAEQQLLVLASQLVYQAPYRVWRVVDVAEKPDFALAALFGPVGAIVLAPSDPDALIPAMKKAWGATLVFPRSGAA